MSSGKITLWLPEQDRVRLALFGKLAEEAGELSIRATRCTIQGYAGLDPGSGRTNLEELAREAADVRACLQAVEDGFHLSPFVSREREKAAGYALWHQMIREHECRKAT